MLSGCSRLMWVRSPVMWAGQLGYSQPMWSRIKRCYSAERFMFSGRYRHGGIPAWLHIYRYPRSVRRRAQAEIVLRHAVNSARSGRCARNPFFAAVAVSCRKRKPVTMDCEPAASIASRLANNVSPPRRSVAVNLSWELRLLRAGAVWIASRYT